MHVKQTRLGCEEIVLISATALNGRNHKLRAPRSDA